MDTYTKYSCLICGETYTIKNPNLSFDIETCCYQKMDIETAEEMMKNDY